MKRYCLALDLVNDAALIKEYEEYHKPENAWPEITESLKQSGIINLEIYRTGNRLFMLMETENHFSFNKKAQMDKDNKKVQEWETLMWKFQQALPWAEQGEKWVVMEKIYQL